MILITKAQISKIHVLLSQMDLMGEKKEFVKLFSNGQVTSTAAMEINEARAFLSYLSQYDPLDGMRRRIFSLAYEAGIIYGQTDEDKRMNCTKIDKFLKERGTVKKALNKMDKSELKKTVAQFQSIKKNMEFSQAGKVTKEMLTDLNISTH